MKILIPVISFSKSGGGRVLSNLANQWKSFGHEVKFVVASMDSGPNFPTTAEIIYGTCNEKRDGVLQKMGCLRQLVNKHAIEFDIILANHNLTAWAVWLAGSNARSKTVYYSQAYEVDFYTNHRNKLSGLLLVVLAWGSYRLFSNLVVNAPVYLSYKGICAIDWVPPGIDSEKFFPLGIHSRNANQDFVIGCIGRFEPWKGTYDVYEAARILRQRGVNFRLRVAFNGLSGYDDIQDIVEIINPGNDDELGQFYRSCDVLIAPGQIQLGAPHYPVMEAMACGIPVVNTGYIPATHENSWIVPIKNPVAIADAIVDIMTNQFGYQEKLLNALDAVRDFSWDNVASKFIWIFQDRIKVTHYQSGALTSQCSAERNRR